MGFVELSNHRAELEKIPDHDHGVTTSRTFPYLIPVFPWFRKVGSEDAEHRQARRTSPPNAFVSGLR